MTVTATRQWRRVAILMSILMTSLGTASFALIVQDPAGLQGVSRQLAQAQGAPASTPLQFPVGTWLARALPNERDVPCRTGCKHIRLEHNPDDGLIYLMGGDHKGSDPGHHQSGRNEMYTYSIARDEWRLIQPYCRSDRGPQPAGADEVGWTYDRIRRVFWMVPGFLGGKKACPDGQLLRDKIMHYDPQKASWTVLEASFLRGPRPTQAFHDAKTDTIISLTSAAVLAFDPSSSVWTRVPLRSIPKARLHDTLPTFDREGRYIYFIPQSWDQLFRYHVDTQAVEDLGPTPPGGYVRERMPVWDSVNRVLLFPAFDPETWNITLHVWNPRSAKWITDQMRTEIAAGTVRGRHAVFDPYLNVLLVMGSPDGQVWLYRYGS